ncbi:MAG: hypothetical protein Q7K16_01760, partial [Candidatus Azambacteria bacterium]|nr:hypothetical protein [Candidatus Azambacteria bacterium]
MLKITSKNQSENLSPFEGYPEGRQYIPLSKAAEILGTSRDYVNVLVRRGKLRAIKLGRNWVTASKWLNEYRGLLGKSENSSAIPLSEAGKILNTSRDYVNVLVRRKKLRAFKLGRNWFTTKRELEEYQKLARGSFLIPTSLPADPRFAEGSGEARDLAKAEKSEFESLKTKLVLEHEVVDRLKKVESQVKNFDIARFRDVKTQGSDISRFRDLDIAKIRNFALNQEIKLSSRELKPDEKSVILESVKENIKSRDVSEFQKASKLFGISKSLKLWSNLKLSLASGFVVMLLTISVGLAFGIVPFKSLSWFKKLNPSQYQAALVIDVFKRFPRDVPEFSKWAISLFQTKSIQELAVGVLKSGKSKLITPKEDIVRIDTVESAFALDSGLASEALAKEGSTSESAFQFSTTTTSFLVFEDRLSALENTLVDQIALVKADLSIQKKTILGTLGTLIGISKLLPIHPISTIVVQGSPATLTTYSIQPQVNTGFDRLSAEYFNLSHDAIINGHLTVKSGGDFNTLSVSGASSLGSLSVSGDSTLNNLTITGTLNAASSSVSFGNASTTYLTVSNTAWINQLAITGTATTTFNNPIASFSGSLIIAGDSASNILLNPYGGNIGIGTTTPDQKLTVWGNGMFFGTLSASSTAYLPTLVTTNGTITNASTTYATLPTFWGTNGTVTEFNFTNATGTRLSITNATTTSLAVTGTATTTFSGPIISSSGDFIIAGNSANDVLLNPYGGNIGIGTTTPDQKLTVWGNGMFFGTLSASSTAYLPTLVTTNGTITNASSTYLTVGNSAWFGASSADTLAVNSSINSNLIPDLNAVRDLGSSAFYWDDAFIDTLTVNNISAASTTIAGTQSATFTINSDNASADQEDETLIFFRGTVVPNALLTWNAATSSKRFELNQALYINNGSASTTNPTFTVQTIANQTVSGLQIIDNNSNNLFSVNPVGSNTTMVNASSTNLTATNFWSTNGTITNASTTNLTVSGNLWAGSSGVFFLADGSVINPSLAFTNDTDTGIFRIGDNKMGFATGATTSLTLDSGKVIIGNDISTASYQLEVADRDVNNNTIVDELRLSHFTTGTVNDGMGTGLLFYGQDNLGAGQNMARIASQVEHATTSEGFLANLSFYTVGSGGLLEKMRITGNGGLALATTTVPTGYGANIATSTFVYGNLTVSDSSIFKNASTTYLSSSDTAWFNNLIATNATTTTFRSDGLATFGGNVGIGTTTPGAKLEIVSNSGATTTDQLFLTNFTSSTTTAARLSFRAADISGVGTTTSAITSILQQNWTTGKGDLAFSTLRSGSLTEAMRINDLGY